MRHFRDLPLKALARRRGSQRNPRLLFSEEQTSPFQDHFVGAVSFLLNIPPVLFTFVSSLLRT